MIVDSSARRFFLFSVPIAFVVPVLADGHSAVRTPDGRLFTPDIAKIINRGKLIVALLDKDTPPFVFVKGGVLKGVDVDLVRHIAMELNVPVEFDRTASTYNAVAQRVAEGHADLGVSKLARTLKRAQSVQFSIPYMQLNHALLVNRLAFAKIARGQSVSQTVRNFSGKIGVIAGSSWEEFARRNFHKSTTVRFESWGHAVDAVKKGEVVAIYRDAVEVGSIMRSDPRLALILQTVTFNDLNSLLSVVVGFSNHGLKSFVDEVILHRNEKLTVDGLLKLREM